MSQFEFVSRLRRCLAGLPEEEIDRAVEYYEDYFADALESDEEVIKKLGSPEELAENIRRELSEKQEKISGRKEEDQGVFTEHGFETKQDRENYQQLDKFTQLEKKENPFEKKEEAKDHTENKEQRTSGNYDSGQYHYDDKKERKKNRRFIATLMMIFGFVWICIFAIIIGVYTLFFSGSSDETTVTEYAEEVGDIINQVAEDFEEEHDEAVEGTADILPDQDIQELKIEMEAGEKIVIQEGKKFSLKVSKNSNHVKVKSNVKNGVWKIRDEGNFHFSLKDIKDIGKGLKGGVSILITVPKGFQADKVSINLDAGKVVANTLLTKIADFEIGAGTITMQNLTVTDEMDLAIGMGKADISNAVIQNLQLECDMGKASVEGTLIGRNVINCDMGAVKLRLQNPASDYSFLVKNDMGSITIDEEKYHGSFEQGNGNAHVELNVDMGSIDVKTNLGYNK